ncbi:FG-GAP-like repeat-containing protein [Conexibacter stalactiti]|uniref:FG-GAP-like repeat-containing protein n=1 Tax=Conexibacter stalactiti TaxID=1940611 RepID=A0ABU4HNF6_9ACTN|nr:FG-GAP-like repeat-containing protein [Conexibacter stalactiti]MDW5594804.1 FG-GAP-like repeat-containing protein [Conexibacter stalactiti]MEC5035446.1 FG-GAP-like repeat-containing protein [Conexibacter stalactiti]
MFTHRFSRLALPVGVVLTLAATAPAAHALGFAEAPGSPYLSTVAPSESATADFDGDGNADVVTAYATPYYTPPRVGEIVVRLGDGNGGFSAQAPIVPASPPESLIVGDLDGDDAPDVVTGDADGTLTALLGDGDGGLTRAWTSGFLGRWTQAAIADVAGSPAPDLLVTVHDAGPNVQVLVGAGDGTFAPGGTITVNDGPSRPAVADLDGDGTKDVVTTGFSGSGYFSLAVQLGDGAGGWSEAPGSPYATGTAPSRPYIADFNADGTPDIAYPNVFSHSIGVLLGDGDGGFAAVPGSPIRTVPWPARIATADFDGNGTTDIAAVNNDGHEIAVHLGDGSGGFTDAAGGPFATAGTGWALAPADVDGDGLTDLVVTGWHELSVLLNRITTPDAPWEPRREQPGDEEQPGGEEQPGNEPGREQPGEEEPKPEDVPAILHEPGPISGLAPHPRPLGEIGDLSPVRPVARAGATTSLPRILSTTLRVRRGTAVVRIACPAGSHRCAGAVRLRAAGRNGALLGSGRLTAGGARSAKVTLNRLGRRTLGRQRTGALPVRIVVVLERTAATSRQVVETPGSLR